MMWHCDTSVVILANRSVSASTRYLPVVKESTANRFPNQYTCSFIIAHVHVVVAVCSSCCCSRSRSPSTIASACQSSSPSSLMGFWFVRTYSKDRCFISRHVHTLGCCVLVPRPSLTTTDSSIPFLGIPRHPLSSVVVYLLTVSVVADLRMETGGTHRKAIDADKVFHRSFACAHECMDRRSDTAKQRNLVHRLFRMHAISEKQHAVCH